MKNLKEKISYFGAVIVIAVLFILVSYLVQINIGFVKNVIFWNNSLSMSLYILITMIENIFIGFTTIPLIPIASNAWGWFLAGILTLIGWALGSFIAFFIARRFGKNFLKKFIDIKKIECYEDSIPKKNLFLDLILLRLAFPIDILSYAMGIFSKVDYKTYIITTVLGFLPYAFFYSYFGTLPLDYQIIAFIIFILILSISILIGIRKIKEIKCDI